MRNAARVLERRRRSCPVNEGLRHARRTYESIAADRKGDIESQVEWLEAELKSGVAEGYESGKQHLFQADRIKNAVTAQWPIDPTALYRLVCFLTHQDPVLSESTEHHAVPENPTPNQTSR